MDFLLIVIVSLIALGIVAAIFSIGSSDDEPIVNKEDGCASCTSRKDCKLADLADKSKKVCHLLLIILLLTGCSTKKNTPQSCQQAEPRVGKRQLRACHREIAESHQAA